MASSSGWKREKSWITLGASFAAADGSTPVTAIIELRTSDGQHRADLFEADRDVLLDLLYEVGTCPEQKFILGRRTARFEEALRAETDAAEAVACSSGTSALTLILSAIDCLKGIVAGLEATGSEPQGDDSALIAALDAWVQRRTQRWRQR